MNIILLITVFFATFCTQAATQTEDDFLSAFGGENISRAASPVSTMGDHQASSFEDSGLLCFDFPAESPKTPKRAPKKSSDSLSSDRTPSKAEKTKDKSEQDSQRKTSTGSAAQLDKAYAVFDPRGASFKDIQNLSMQIKLDFNDQLWQQTRARASNSNSTFVKIFSPYIEWYRRINPELKTNQNLRGPPYYGKNLPPVFPNDFSFHVTLNDGVSPQQYGSFFKKLQDRSCVLYGKETKLMGNYVTLMLTLQFAKPAYENTEVQREFTTIFPHLPHVSLVQISNETVATSYIANDSALADFMLEKFFKDFPYSGDKEEYSGKFLNFLADVLDETPLVLPKLTQAKIRYFNQSLIEDVPPTDYDELINRRLDEESEDSLPSDLEDQDKAKHMMIQLGQPFNNSYISMEDEDWDALERRIKVVQFLTVRGRLSQSTKIEAPYTLDVEKLRVHVSIPEVMGSYNDPKDSGPAVKEILQQLFSLVDFSKKEIVENINKNLQELFFLSHLERQHIQQGILNINKTLEGNPIFIDLSPDIFTRKKKQVL